MFPNLDLYGHGVRAKRQFYKTDRLGACALVHRTGNTLDVLNSNFLITVF